MDCPTQHRQTDKMELPKIFTDEQLLFKMGKTICVIMQGQTDEQYAIVLERATKNCEFYTEKNNGNPIFKKALVFMKCVRGFKDDKDKSARLFVKTFMNEKSVLSVFVQYWSWSFNPDALMERFDEEKDAGGMTDGVYLQSCNLLKVMHEVKNFTIETRKVVLCE